MFVARMGYRQCSRCFQNLLDHLLDTEQALGPRGDGGRPFHVVWSRMERARGAGADRAPVLRGAQPPVTDSGSVAHTNLLGSWPGCEISTSNYAAGALRTCLCLVDGFTAPDLREGSPPKRNQLEWSFRDSQHGFCPAGQNVAYCGSPNASDICNPACDPSNLGDST